jgi:ribosomal protein S3
LSIGLEKDVFSSSVISTLRVPEGVNTEKNAKIKDEPSVNLLGFLIQIKGRINGSDRSRRLKYRIGSVPLHTINAPID